jgi:Zn finger protein HypA/HybF involved in hydrogenase expression
VKKIRGVRRIARLLVFDRFFKKHPWMAGLDYSKIELRILANQCWCYRCDQEGKTSYGRTGLRDRMNLCPDCGNKRCPRATDHRLTCTGSNEPGQPGSIYA